MGANLSIGTFLSKSNIPTPSKLLNSMKNFGHFANSYQTDWKGRHADRTSDQTMAASWPKSIQVLSSEIEEEPVHVRETMCQVSVMTMPFFNKSPK